MKQKGTRLALIILVSICLSTLKSESQNAWAPVGDLMGTVHTLFIFKGELYAGGQGLQNNNTSYLKNYVMKWNGASWDTVGGNLQKFSTQVTAMVNCFAEYNNELYIGGMFGNNFVLKWDGSNWISCDNGFLAHEVTSLIVFNSELIAAESMYTPIGSDSTVNIGKWDGQQWVNIGSTQWGQFYTLAEYKNELYVGGDFYNFNGDTTIGYDIVKWDGANWQSVAGGTALCFTSINHLHKSKENTLIATGGFSTIGGISTNSIGEWDGNHWNSMNGALTNGVAASCYSDSTLFIATTSGNPAFFSFFKIENNSSQAFGYTKQQPCGVYFMLSYNSDLYISGHDMDNHQRGVAKLSLTNSVGGEQSDISSIVVSPNPSSDFITVSLKTHKKNPAIEIVDVMGRQVLSVDQGLMFNGHIDISHLPQGLYLLKVSDGEVHFAKRFVKN